MLNKIDTCNRWLISSEYRTELSSIKFRSVFFSTFHPCKSEGREVVQQLTEPRHCQQEVTLTSEHWRGAIAAGQRRCRMAAEQQHKSYLSLRTKQCFHTAWSVSRWAVVGRCWRDGGCSYTWPGSRTRTPCKHGTSVFTFTRVDILRLYLCHSLFVHSHLDQRRHDRSVHLAEEPANLETTVIVIKKSKPTLLLCYSFAAAECKVAPSDQQNIT